MPMTYGDITTNLNSGTGTIGNSSPRVPGDNISNRHCCAYEQICPAIVALADAIDIIAAKVGADVSSYTTNARELASESIMQMNRGR